MDNIHPDEMPLGLNHALLCSGSTSKDVNRVLYWQLRASAVGVSYKTFVFPEWVRELLRARFGATGMYDHQYEGRQDVYIVTDADLGEIHQMNVNSARWRCQARRKRIYVGPQEKCRCCKELMKNNF